MEYLADDNYYKNAKKTPENMKQIIKIQGKRLKKLNEDYRGLLKEQKRTYKEMVYFRFKARRKTQIINKAIKYIEEYYKKNNFYESIENCMTFCEFDKNDLLNILKGGNNEK